MSYEYYDQLPPVAAARYDEKLKICGLSECPYRLPGLTWQDDPTGWPDVTYGDIYHYLIESPGPHTRQSMKAHKSLESERFFLSGWVHKVLHFITLLGTYIFKAQVTPSYRVNEPPHTPWVAASQDGSIIAAHCDCKAGLGESCSHVGALLFKVEAAVRLGITRPACTDLPCEWNGTSMTGVKPAEVSEINFYSDEAKIRLREKEVKRRRSTPAPPSEEEQEAMLRAICRVQSVKPVVMSFFSETVGNFYMSGMPEASVQMPQPLRTWFLPDSSKASDAELDAMCAAAVAKFSVSEAEREYITRMTVSQGGSQAWHEQRLGRITASNAHAVLHTDPVTPARSVILRVTAQKPDLNMIPAVKWGREKEAVALADFKNRYISQHRGAEVMRTGFAMHPSKQFIGASCDALISCDCCGEGCLEIKCPYSWKDATVAETCEEKSSYLAQDGSLKKDHPYGIYDQLQIQMFSTGRSFAILHVWLVHDSKSITIQRDDQYFNQNVPALEGFWKRHIIPELVTRRIENGQPTPIPTSTETLYCYCQQPESESMVGCDNASCPFNGWIHFRCAGLKRKPRSKTWLCRSCRRKR